MIVFSLAVSSSSQMISSKPWMYFLHSTLSSAFSWSSVTLVKSLLKLVLQSFTISSQVWQRSWALAPTSMASRNTVTLFVIIFDQVDGCEDDEKPLNWCF